MGGSTVLVAVVSRTVNQKLVCLARRNRQKSSVGRALTTPFILVLLTSSRYFLPSLLSFLTAWRWSVVEDFLSTVKTLINSMIVRRKLKNFHWLMSPGFVGPGRNYWPESWLKFLWWVGDISIFIRIEKAIYPPKEASTLLRMHIQCFFSNVAKISIPVGSHISPRHNSYEDISPQFVKITENNYASTAVLT